MTNLRTFASRAAAGVVAGVAAIASYSHMRDLAAEHGQSSLLANLLPLSVDGMLIVASVVMADDRAAGRKPRTSARLSFGVGVAASLAANVLAAPDDPTARVISAWPAVALLLVVEMLIGGARHARAVEAVAPATAPEPVKIEPAIGEVAAPADPEQADPREAARRVYRLSAANGSPLSGAALARQFGKSDRWGVERVKEVRAEIGKVNGRVPELTNA